MYRDQPEECPVESLFQWYFGFSLPYRFQFALIHGVDWKAVGFPP